jgi:mycoredoxin
LTDGASGSATPPPLPDGLGGDAAVTVMLRPGCPFCSLLVGRLERSGLAFDRIDIWDEPAAAAWVRTVADGNETVPTVRIVGADPDAAVALVNPSATEVLEHLARLAPGHLPPAPGGPKGSGVSGPLAPAPLARLVAWLRGRRGRDRGRAASR